MRLLVVILVALTAPFPAQANGSPCGGPPKLDNAEASRVISRTVRADLGSAPVKAPFVNRARQSIAELIEQYGLSRAQVVEVYVFHICETLYARGTGPGELSEALSRMKRVLAEPAPETESAAADDDDATTGGAAHVETPRDQPESAASAPPSTAQAKGESAPGANANTANRQPSTIVQRMNRGTPARSDSRRSSRATAPALQQRRADQPAPKPQRFGITQFSTKGAGRSGVSPGGAATPSPLATPDARITRNPSSAPRIAQPAAPASQAAPEDSAAPDHSGAPAASAVMEEAPREKATQAPQAMAAVRAPASPPAPQPEERAAQAPVEEPRATAFARSEAPDEMVRAEQVPEVPEETARAEQTPATSEQEPAASTQTANRRSEDARAAAARPTPRSDEGACAERGVLGPECFDVDAALERLRDRPVEYNHPEQMIKDQATEITLVLRTDFTEEGLPDQASEAFEGLQGEVKQQRAKIANIMSARLRGREFDVDPKGMQERTITWRRPVEWSWYVTPNEGGEQKRLKLELYAHIVNPQGETQPPVLIKTLDATIDVDVRTLDWLIEQAKTFEPIYAVAAAIIGLLTALITVWMRRRPAHPGNTGPPSGITASEAAPDKRLSNIAASDAAAETARTRADDDSGDGRG